MELNINIFRDPIVRSVSYSGGFGRCALGSILKSAPSMNFDSGFKTERGTGHISKSSIQKGMFVPRTKTWSGPLGKRLCVLTRF